jgi:hypothetical protein
VTVPSTRSLVRRGRKPRVGADEVRDDRRFPPVRGSYVSKRADSARDSLFELADLFDVIPNGPRSLMNPKVVEEVRLLQRQGSPSAIDAER